MLLVQFPFPEGDKNMRRTVRWRIKRLGMSDRTIHIFIFMYVERERERERE